MLLPIVVPQPPHTVNREATLAILVTGVPTSVSLLGIPLQGVSDFELLWSTESCG